MLRTDRRRLLPVVLVVALALAGCVGEPAGDEPGPEENVVPDPPQADTASEDPDVLQNEVDQPPGSGA